MNRAAIFTATIAAFVCTPAKAGVPFDAGIGNGDEAIITPVVHLARFSPIMEFEQWRERAGSEGFAGVEESLLAQLAASGSARDLIYFYAAHGLWPETLSIIHEQNVRSAEIMLLEGVAHFQMGRWDDAVAVLNADIMHDVDAAAAWRGLANARRGADKAAAGDLFAVAAMPAPFELNAGDFFLARADIALGGGDAALARAALDDLRGRALSGEQRAMRRLIEARLMLAGGKRDNARRLLENLVAMGMLPAANFAALELTRDSVAAGEIDPRAALSQTEALFLTWSGGAFERATLQFNAELYGMTGDIAESFRARRRIIENFPQSDAADEARRQMREMLSALEDRKDLSPLTAAEIFYENIDAAPPGIEGDALIRNVAGQLAALDLLKQAAELLHHQVFERLRGAPRSQTAADLAAIYLDSDRPLNALQVLRATRLARLPQAVNDRRRQLEARALIQSGDTDAALNLLANDMSAHSARLRGEIFWAAQDWRAAGAAYAAALGSDAAGPIDEAAARVALKAAAAFALAGDAAALGELEEKIGPRLADEHFKALLNELAGGGLSENPDRFIAAYERYFGDPGES